MSTVALVPGEGSVWERCPTFCQQGAAIEWVKMVIVFQPNRLFRAVEPLREYLPSEKSEEIVPKINAGLLKSSVFFSLKLFLLFPTKGIAF